MAFTFVGSPTHTWLRLPAPPPPALRYMFPTLRHGHRTCKWLVMDDTVGVRTCVDGGCQPDRHAASWGLRSQPVPHRCTLTVTVNELQNAKLINNRVTHSCPRSPQLLSVRLAVGPPTTAARCCGSLQQYNIKVSFGRFAIHMTSYVPD